MAERIIDGLPEAQNLQREEAVTIKTKEHPSQPKTLSIGERIGLTAYIARTMSKSHYFPPDVAGYSRLLKLLGSVYNAEKTDIFAMKELFSDHIILAEGVENIPKDGKFVIISNHYNRGPYLGMWQTPAIAETIAPYIPQGKGTHCRFIMDSDKIGEIDPFINRKSEEVKAILSKAHCSDNVLKKVDSLAKSIKDISNPKVSRVLINIAETLDFISVGNFSSLKGAFRRRDILGVFPSAQAETELNQGLPEADKFLRMVAGTVKMPILPIGAFHHDKAKIIRIRIGEPLKFSKKEVAEMPEMELVDKGMCAIATLLPEELRGYYKNQINQPERKKIYEPIQIFP